MTSTINPRLTRRELACGAALAGACVFAGNLEVKPACADEAAQPQTTQQRNIESALALINTFANGDAELAATLLDEGYIQHNLAYGTGRDAFVGSVEYLAAADAPTTVNTIRSFADGDYVFLQTVYNFAGAGEQVAFDIFRFNEAGLIAEHWDNLASVAEPNPSGHTQIDSTLEITEPGRTAQNRQLVCDFLFDVMQGNKPEKTPDYFDGDTYIQHNTAIADGLSGLSDALAALAEQGIEMIYNRTHMVLAQGDFVLAVSEGSYAGAPQLLRSVARRQWQDR